MIWFHLWTRSCWGTKDVFIFFSLGQAGGVDLLHQTLMTDSGEDLTHISLCIQKVYGRFVVSVLFPFLKH